ncbi:hypothetical protein [Algoriphagus sediminis]|uniref:Class I SAM-dependent methyltransferase n=1 Tax=Algoriphagus sediminis TaxID=3057113 RepID=A0ABT7Y992_9BACT|nr:hypothetical protein [Algoriphagus sediminis]MDN3202995.1 hypothetical protein [Algoriphagus sediminis]
MKNRAQAIASYKYFSKKEGNQHIAGQYALEKILDIIEINQPSKILEVGLGIGSISYTILNSSYYKNEDLIYHGTEANEFCLNALKSNLGTHYDRVSISSDLHSMNSEILYDLIIIDGSDESITEIKGKISPHGVIFIEGHRGAQTETMKEVFPNHKHTLCISDFKNSKDGPFSSDSWSGGGQLIYVNPTTKQLIHFLKERFNTSFKYRVSRRIKR